MRVVALVIAVCVVASGCASVGGREGTEASRREPPPPAVSSPAAPRRDAPAPSRPSTSQKPGVPGQVFTGKASWYGEAHQGKKTASGERYDMNEMTAAHRTLPLGTRARVTNLDNGKSVVVRINDRGPFIDGRIIDLSRAAARELGVLGAGLFTVRVEVLEEAAAEAPPSGRR